MTAQAQTQGAEAILDDLSEAVRSRQDAGEGRVSVGTILDGVRHRSYGPFLLVPAILELTPIGGIPGVPTAIALFLFLTAAQLLAGREHIWVPQFLEKRTVNEKKFEAAEQKLRPLARWLDRHTRERFRPLVRKPARKAAAIIVMLLCLTVPPLELIPFASSIPMATIALFGLALLVRDGLVMLLAFIATGAAAVGMFFIA